MGIFDFLKSGKKQQLSDALADGALIVDVRSASEFSSGHVTGSSNIPLEQVGSHFKKWQQDNETIIFCCASGIRSGKAANQARSAGITALNGGGWVSLRKVVSIV